MGFINKCVLLGNVTRDPEVKLVNDKNLPICKFGLAINRRYKHNDEFKDDVCFIDVVAFGKNAEICGEFLSKGNQVLIEGRLSYNKWEQEGSIKAKHEVIAENVQLLSKGQKRTETNSNVSLDDIDVIIPF
ncbi:MAG: single-stranded DNA-binding protein [Denitrovibrio sp.]|nr:MAG: single-stranded DNA-binding protein [Denitrovibrio sp.]